MVAGFASVLTTERELPMRGDQIAVSSEGDPSGDPCRLRCHSGQSRTKARRRTGICKTEQVLEVCLDWPEDHLRTGVVLTTGEVGSERFQIVEKRCVDFVRAC
jgi:hypothetical protein